MGKIGYRPYHFPLDLSRVEFIPGPETLETLLLELKTGPYVPDHV